MAYHYGGGDKVPTREDSMIVENIGTDSDSGSAPESDIGVETTDDVGFKQVSHGRTRNKRPRLLTNTSEYDNNQTNPTDPPTGSTPKTGASQSTRPKFVPQNLHRQHMDYSQHTYHGNRRLVFK